MQNKLNSLDEFVLSKLAAQQKTVKKHFEVMVKLKLKNQNICGFVALMYIQHKIIIFAINSNIHFYCIFVSLLSINKNQEFFFFFLILGDTRFLVTSRKAE